MTQALTIALFAGNFPGGKSQQTCSFLWRNCSGPNKANNPSSLVATPTDLIRKKKDLILHFSLSTPGFFCTASLLSFNSQSFTQLWARQGCLKGRLCRSWEWNIATALVFLCCFPRALVGMSWAGLIWYSGWIKILLVLEIPDWY